MITYKFGENTVSLTDYDVVNAIELLSENGPYHYNPEKQSLTDYVKDLCDYIAPVKWPRYSYGDKIQFGDRWVADKADLQERLGFENTDSCTSPITKFVFTPTKATVYTAYHEEGMNDKVLSISYSHINTDKLLARSLNQFEDVSDAITDLSIESLKDTPAKQLNDKAISTYDRLHRDCLAHIDIDDIYLGEEEHENTQAEYFNNPFLENEEY